MPRQGRRLELAFHVTMRPSDDRGLVRDAAGLRRAAKIFFEQGAARGLLAFRIADTHAHALLATDRASAGQFACYAQSALRQALALPLPFEPARYRRVAQTSHLRNAVRYLFQQERHHGTDFDAAHDGSSLPDLVGMRWLDGGGARDRLRELLPRLTSAEVREWAGLADPNVIEADPRLIAEAAAATLGLPDLDGGGWLEGTARLAAAHASALPSNELAPLLGVTRRRVQRYRASAAHPGIVHAVKLQLSHRTALRRRAQEW